jgi:hypothetical protein
MSRPGRWALGGQMQETLRIHGKANIQVFHVAMCNTCTPKLPIPFSSTKDRDYWAETLSNWTGHGVEILTEVRVTQ